MQITLPIRRALIVLATLLVLSVTPAWATSYTITDLGTLGGSVSLANGVNSAGQVVGQASNSAGSYLGFLCQSGTLKSTGTVSGGTGSTATGVNSSGEVVGSATDSLGQSHAFTFSNGAFQQLSGFSGGIGSYAMGVNTSGQIAGYAQDAMGLKHAVVWVNGNMSDLGNLGGLNAVAQGINDSGHVVGFSYLAGNSVAHAFCWNGSSMQDLGTLGGISSYAYGINNNGVVVGYSYTSSGSEHAFLWNGSSMQDLGTLATYSYAYAVNDNNQVVGMSSGVAFLYSGGTMINLNSVLPSGSPWTLNCANAINDSGQIVGYGTINGQMHAFLLSPVSSAPPAPPAAPSSLSASGGANQVALAWSAPSGASSYNVYRATSSGGESLYQSGVSGTSFTDSAVSAGTTYYYEVTAVGSGGESSRSNEASAAPTAPVSNQSVSINCGGVATGSFVGDTDYSGGSTWTAGQSINTSGVANAAPASVYQSQRYGNFTYNIGGLTPNASYTVLLHFTEAWFGPGMPGGGGTGSRVFDVSINGKQVLTNFDVYATAGAAAKALVESFSATANSSGTISITFASVVSNAMVEGIQVTPSSGGGTTSGQTVAQIDAGGGSVGSFIGDADFSGGSTWSTTQSISTSGVTNAAPASVYQTQRYGNFTYSIGGLTPNASYTVRLHFAESWFGPGMPGAGGTGSRVFDVAVNGQPALTNFDVYAAAGANKALVESFTTTANSAGVISIQFTSVVTNAEVNGIEVLTN